MGFLRTLFGGSDGSPSDSSKEMRKLAILLATEIRLYNSDAVEDVGEGLPMSEVLQKELARSFRIYTKKVGSSAEAENIFRVEAARLLTGGDEDAIPRS